MSRSKLRLLLWRWHRRVGLFAAFFVIALSISGILLNHTDELKLDKTSLRSRLLLSLYGVSMPEIVSFRLNGDWISHIGSNYLYLNTRELAYCAGRFQGALNDNGLWVVACGNELLLFTPAGEVVERIGAQYGLPQPIEKIGKCKQHLCLQSKGQVYFVDIEQLIWRPVAENAIWVTAAVAPATVRRYLIDNYLGGDITWERLLLDLHSGRLWGKGGQYFTDFIAVLFVLLACTGAYMWLAGQRRRR